MQPYGEAPSGPSHPYSTIVHDGHVSNSDTFLPQHRGSRHGEAPEQPAWGFRQGSGAAQPRASPASDAAYSSGIRPLTLHPTHSTAMPAAPWGGAHTGPVTSDVRAAPPVSHRLPEFMSGRPAAAPGISFSSPFPSYSGPSGVAPPFGVIGGETSAYGFVTTKGSVGAAPSGGADMHHAPLGGPPDSSDFDVPVEPPLLEELGVHVDEILKRMISVMLFRKIDHDLLVGVDMCGPLLIAVCLGCCLLLAGKIHFGYIYGLSVFGCAGMCLLLNLMSQKEAVDLYRATSILGYGLLPVVGLALISIFTHLRTLYGCILSVLCVLWCTLAASRFFATALQMHHQRFLVAYPVLLIYACFVMITVF